MRNKIRAYSYESFLTTCAIPFFVIRWRFALGAGTAAASSSAGSKSAAIGGSAVAAFLEGRPLLGVLAAEPSAEVGGSGL